MKWFGLCMVLAGCIETSSVTCDDGTLCPAGTKCAAITNPDQTLCVLQDQLDACHGIADHVACHTAAIATGRCYDGTCLRVACGNGRVDSADPAVPGDVGETCDDHNNVSGDGCSADCLSNETCGNGVLDGVNYEQCDDGNLVDHDGCNSRCLPEQPVWRELAIDRVDRRFGPAIAYDLDRRRAIMFGGSQTDDNTTWSWNGIGWSLVSPPTSPPGRSNGGVAYDTKRHRIVLFGGGSAQTSSLQYADTWEWDGAAWSERAVPVAPSPRQGLAMAYDAGRGKVVVFGGARQGPQSSFPLGDTWEWDGTAWAQITTVHTPTPRAGAAMAYDPIRGRIVMFGGGGTGFTIFSDTYEYDGVDWHLMSPATSPGVLAGASMAWDPVSRRLIMFGGNDTGNLHDDTWSWDGTTWALATVTQRPSARSDFGLVTDAARGQLILFGGDSVTATWAWTGSDWTDVTPVAIDPDALEAAAVDPLRGAAVIVDPYGQTWETDGESWRTTNVYPGAPRGDVTMVYDAAIAMTVLVGGTDSGSGMSLADTWTWDGTTWTNATGSQPSARVTAIAYDAKRQRVVLFGGTPSLILGEAAGLADTWEWDGTTWTEVHPVHSPPARYHHALAFDPISERVLVFGGTTTNPDSELGDTWAWDGTDWTQLHPTHAPAARDSAALAWHPSRRRLTLYGGIDVADFADAWEWDGADWVFVAATSAPPARSDAAVFSARAGAGIVVVGGQARNPAGPPFLFGDSWELRWDSISPDEGCEIAADLDSDGLVGCADPDCAYACTPACPPGTSCDPSAPRCGDGVCDAALETCGVCPADCGACTVLCGDARCDATESHADCPGDCP